MDYRVHALAVDDVAGALQADAGDGDGSADVGGGRAEVAQGRAGAPAEANGLCVRTGVTMVAVLTGQIALCSRRTSKVTKITTATTH